MSDIETQKQAEETVGIKTSIAPWLTVTDSLQAIAFYKAAGTTRRRTYREAVCQWRRILGERRK